MLVAFSQASFLLLLGVHVLAARELGEAAFGRFTLALTIATLLVVLPAWGTLSYSSIMAARSPERTPAILADSLGLMLLSGSLYLAAVAAAAVLMGPERVGLAVALLLAGDWLIHQTNTLFRLLFRANDLFALESISALLERSLIAAGAAGVLLLRPDPLLLAAAFVAGRAGGVLAAGSLFVHRIGPIGVSLDLRALRRLIAAGTPLAVRIGLGNLSFRNDTLFLGALRSSTEIGWYGAAYRLMDAAFLLPDSVTGSLAPRLSASFAAEQHEQVIRLYRRGYKYLLLGGLLATVGLAVLAEPLVELIYGSDYAPAAAALRVLAPGVVFLFLRRLLLTVLDNVDLRKTAAVAIGSGLVLNVALNLVLIPRYGILGAGSATTLTEAFLMLAMVWLLRRRGYSLRSVGTWARAVPAALVAGALMLALIRLPVLAFIAGGALYVCLLGVWGVWDDKDRELARAVRDAAAERLGLAVRPGPR